MKAGQPVWIRGQRFGEDLDRDLALRLVSVGSRVALPIPGVFQPGLFPEANYDVMPDGTGVIVVTPTDGPSRAPNGPGDQAFNIVINWLEELKARAPMK